MDVLGQVNQGCLPSSSGKGAMNRSGSLDAMGPHRWKAHRPQPCFLAWWPFFIWKDEACFFPPVLLSTHPIHQELDEWILFQQVVQMPECFVG